MTSEVIVPAVFALLGVGVGGLITWRLQATQLKHLDKVRFDSQRLDAYADLMFVATRLHVRMRRSEPFEYVDHELYDRWTSASARVILLSSRDTGLWLAEYGKTLGMAIKQGCPLSDEFSDVLGGFQAELGNALRRELGAEE